MLNFGNSLIFQIERFRIFYHFLKQSIIAPRENISLGEILAARHAYNPIQDSGETLGEREKSRQKSHREFRREIEIWLTIYLHTKYDLDTDLIRTDLIYASV